MASAGSNESTIAANLNSSTVSFSATTSTFMVPAVNLTSCNLADVNWLYYVSTYAAIYMSGVFSSVVCVLVYRKCRNNEKFTIPPEAALKFAKVKKTCSALMAGETLPGKIAMFILFLFSILSWVLFIIHPNFSGVPYIMYCDPPGAWIAVADFIFNMYFLAIFFVRFLASNNRIKFWFTINTVVDCCTIPNAMFSFSQTNDFAALSFLRSVRLINFTDILIYVGVLRGYRAIRISQLLCLLLAVWLTSTGFFVVIENAGNFWSSERTFNGGMNFYVGIYFMLVTMSTIGYGDITCATLLGRTFISIFIGFAVGMFAILIPELAGLLKQRGPQKRRFRKYPGEKHIVVCGSLTYLSMRNFLQNFFREARREASRDVRVVFLLADAQIDLKIEALWKKYSTKMDLFRGNPTAERDLDRVHTHSALAVIIMCNLNDLNPTEQDSTTIMRAMAVKEFCPNVRCIVQLIQYQHKVYLHNIPSWNPDYDGVVCMTELKLGLIAQNCIAPGFCTLITNLIAFTGTKTRLKKDTWQEIYKYGADYEIYQVTFSDMFHNLLFSEAVELCFTRLNVMLIAVDVLDLQTCNTKQILINPSDAVYINPVLMCAFVLAKSESEAKRVSYYCLDCHSNCEASAITSKCSCERLYRPTKHSTSVTPKVSNAAGATRSGANGVLVSASSAATQWNGSVSAPQAAAVANGRHFMKHVFSNSDSILQFSNPAFSPNEADSGAEKENDPSHTSKPIWTHPGTEQPVAPVDSTGLFHWCPARSIDEVRLDADNLRGKTFSNHVVACVISKPETPPLGLVNFIMPLRSVLIKKSDLKPVIFLGDLDYCAREWSSLQNFSEVYLYPGSPLRSADLRAVSLCQCASCVIISSPNTADAMEDDGKWVDNEAVICTLTIKSMLMKMFAADSEDEVFGERINMFTELVNAKNGAFLDDEDNIDNHRAVFMINGFACSRIFNMSVLDSLMSNTFFSADTLRFLQALICGGVSIELEQTLAEENGLPPGKLTDSHKDRFRSTFRLKQLTLRQPPLSNCIASNQDEPIYFRNLFLKALRHHGIICMGMYRKMNSGDTHAACKRFVITFPPRDYVVHQSDLVFCIEPLKAQWQ